MTEAIQAGVNAFFLGATTGALLLIVGVYVGWWLSGHD